MGTDFVRADHRQGVFIARVMRVKQQRSVGDGFRDPSVMDSQPGSVSWDTNAMRPQEAALPSALTTLRLTVRRIHDEERAIFLPSGCWV